MGRIETITTAVVKAMPSVPVKLMSSNKASYSGRWAAVFVTSIAAMN
jgi:hypothetical protein